MGEFLRRIALSCHFSGSTVTGDAHDETAIGRLRHHPGKRLDQLVSIFPAQNPNQGMIYRRQAFALTYELAVSEATEEHDRSRLEVPTNGKAVKLLEVNDPVSPTDALPQ
ncbi:hypothetical protein [Ruegeria sp. 6PALISEP08]|uniref:hypothetical protein n=1 Tax=Ruegeria sp. 6PALISEP08 TaxID=1225660 RepID=UPI00067E78D9|nr:hypothetical protein [Ruegeria sp. 6PALISEP08]